MRSRVTLRVFAPHFRKLRRRLTRTDGFTKAYKAALPKVICSVLNKNILDVRKAFIEEFSALPYKPQQRDKVLNILNEYFDLFCAPLECEAVRKKEGGEMKGEEWED